MEIMSERMRQKEKGRVEEIKSAEIGREEETEREVEIEIEEKTGREVNIERKAGKNRRRARL